MFDFCSTLARLVLYFCLLLAFLTLGLYLGMEITERQIHSEAMDRGYGSKVVDEDGRSWFQWREK